MTTKQYRNRTKTVTRRLGWANLKPGEIFMGVVRGQGIPKGGKVERLHASECVSNCSERLGNIDLADVIREGFLEMSPDEFVDMFCQHNNCSPDTIVNRIEFRHLPQYAHVEPERGPRSRVTEDQRDDWALEERLMHPDEL